jgi:hypothetical protein
MLASAMQLKHGTHFAAFAQEGDRLNFLFAYQPTFDPIAAKGNKFTGQEARHRVTHRQPFAYSSMQ